MSGECPAQTHLDRSKLPDGCNSCHRAHGKSATAMLERPKDELCFKCHGMGGGGRDRPGAQIYPVVLKRSNHPFIRTFQYHVPGEIFPERSASTPRHVSCYDCHNVHLLTKEEPYRGVKGYSGRGAIVARIQGEHQVCYRCHADSANLPSGSSNIALKFAPGNASYHPVEAVGRNRSVPSLKRPFNMGGLIRCSDCHGNDDELGPKGPHGSRHEHMLRLNYTKVPGPEGPYAYELCYSCHERNSILNDESFKSHRRHILYGNASCFACHDSHGSRHLANLINFDRLVASPNATGQLTYLRLSPGKPRCLLTCHVGASQYEHTLTRGLYCINGNCPPEW